MTFNHIKNNVITAKNPAIYIKSSLTDKEEIAAARKYFPVIEYRSHILNKDYDLIIPRYSTLPYYKDVEEDIKYLGSDIISSYQKHNYIADMRNWYQDLKDITPKTWTSLEEIGDNNGPFILKGITNSKKNNWNSLMFANNKKEAIKIYCDLMSDSMIGYQDIVIRKYIELKKLCIGINGLPITDEYRFFVMNGKIIDKGFYWANYYLDLVEEFGYKDDDLCAEKVPVSLINQIIDIVTPNNNFYVFDVAQTNDNNWILIELNCGTCSGLSMINPDNFYRNLKSYLT